MRAVVRVAWLLCFAAGAVLRAGEPATQGDHAEHRDHAEHAEPSVQGEQADHSTHTDHASPPSTVGVPLTPIPALTDADRLAALPPRGSQHGHDHGWQHLLQFDRLEASRASGSTMLGWEAEGWIGTELTRAWLRSEGERTRGETRHASAEVLAGRSISAWWDVLAGVRHDFGAGPERDYFALGVAGLAPYWIEVSATGYVGSAGRTAARVELEHDLLLTNRLVLQSLLKTDLHGKDDPARGIGAGLSSGAFALRLRYEITRRFAPYAGVSLERAFGATAGQRRDAGEDVHDARLVLGLRTWF